ncbi:putative protein kinase [Legionella quinlivanii]|uniref:Protein kinase domain-containing protein n=1 Tax=Legionella quinlivanii TaxID=45073 RepID=A0A0W0Y4M3_9GAMM|nr:protein kinase [Legionella quinlivanii]KTD51943.1 putative protein kinase [Legionella quinlivanii]MCW8452203.1 protein kinase [Legionella quinlivanii]SEF85474.1 Serine/threonine protein kinase [Legionella quinlivanii DSM 21216]STY09594.1 Serine/threonine protein kinase [Legionella quinlivanii]
MTITIKTPSSPTEEERKILAALFAQTSNAEGWMPRYGWRTAKSYDVRLRNLYYDNVYYKDQIETVVLGEKIIRYKSKKTPAHIKQDRLEDNRYGVLAEKPLGKGSFGQAIPVKVTYRLTDGNTDLSFKEKKPGERRLAKQVEHDPYTPRSNYEGYPGLKREYTIASKTPHTHPKQPVMYDGKVYMVERLMEGRCLGDIIDDDRALDWSKAVKPLTMHERFTISINLLEAWKEQVFNPQIIHRDLKPENVIIDDDLNVKTIDFGLARFFGEKMSDDVGSPMYVSPEAVQNKTVDYRADLYSLGRLVALVWRNSAFLYNEAAAGRVLPVARANDYSHMFYGLDVKPEVKDLIVTTLKAMTFIDPKDRISVDEAINNFKRARDLQLPPKLVPQKQDSLTSAETDLAAPNSPPHEKKGILRKAAMFFGIKREKSKRLSINKGGKDELADKRDSHDSSING